MFENVNYITKLLSLTNSDYGRVKKSLFNKTKSDTFNDKLIKKQDSYYNKFKNYKLEDIEKISSNKNVYTKQDHSNAANPNDSDINYGLHTFENNENMIKNRPKYSNLDVSDKKRINLFINKISPNEINLNKNNNYKTSVDFFKNIKSNNAINSNLNTVFNEIKNNQNFEKPNSPTRSHNLYSSCEKTLNNMHNEENINIDNSACQTLENHDDKNQVIIKSNRLNEVNSKNGYNNKNQKNKKISFNFNSFNNTYNTKFSKSNYNINLFNFSNNKKKLNEIISSTENDEKFISESKSNEKFLKIDYDKPAKSTNDILAFIMKTNKMKIKTMDPLLNNERFFFHSQQNFSNINNKCFQESKKNFINKNIKNRTLTNNNQTIDLKNIEFKKNKNLNIQTLIEPKEKYMITTTNLNESFAYNGNYNFAHEDISNPSIFKGKSNSYFTKFYKKNKI